MKTTSPVARALGAFATLALITGLFVCLESLRPQPFATGGDSTFYYLPNIVTANGSILDRGFPRMEWSVGAGKNPWESGQLGPGYPPYLLSVALARWLGRPYVALELSAYLHLVLGWLVVLLGTRGHPLSTRATAALLVCVQPGPILLGLSCHSYLATFPWFSGLCILVLEAFRLHPDRPWVGLLGRRLLVLGVLEILFFWASHIQMFVTGNVLLVLLCLALSSDWRKWLPCSGVLLLGTLPLAVPMLWLVQVVSQAKARTLGVHGSDALLRTSKSIGRVIEQTFFGEVFAPGGSTWGGGWLLFSPCMALLLLAALYRPRSRPLLALLLAFVLYAPASFVPDALRGLASYWPVRWPFKIATLLSPFAALYVAVYLLPNWIRDSRLRGGVVAVLVTASATGILLGQHREGLERLGGIGIRGILEETSACLSLWGMTPHSRVAQLGRLRGLPKDGAVPVAIVGLGGNVPLLLPVTSAHTYEPMEPQAAFLSHLGLGAPWHPNPISAQALKEDREALLERLRSVGVTHLISFSRHPLATLGDPVACEDSNGLKTYAVALPGEKAIRYPWGLIGDKPTPLDVLPDGSLVAPHPSPEPPTTPAIGRALSWRRQADGRWRGVPETLPPQYLWGSLGMGLLWFLAVLSAARRRRSERKTPNHPGQDVPD